MGWLRRLLDEPAEPYRPRPVGCKCGRLFASQSAYSVHRDGDRCLAEHIWAGSQLVQIDGCWHVKGAQP